MSKHLFIQDKISHQHLSSKLTGTLWVRDRSSKNLRESLFPLTMNKIIIVGFEKYDNMSNFLTKFPFIMQYYCVDTNQDTEMALTIDEAQKLLHSNIFIEPSFKLVKPILKK